MIMMLKVLTIQHLFLLSSLGLLLLTYSSSTKNVFVVEGFTTINTILPSRSCSRSSTTMMKKKTTTTTTMKKTTIMKQHQHHSSPPKTLSPSSSSSLLLLSTTDSNNDNIEVDDIDEILSDERKQNLFQYMLRDLQVEGVPLLGVNADKTYIMEAAIWTTLGQLNENPIESKACMIFEKLSIDTLETFVNDFRENLKKKKDSDSDDDGAGAGGGSSVGLQRFNVSLVGKGIGPAILLETSNITTTTTTTTNEEEGEGGDNEAATNTTPLLANEWSWQSSMKSFVERMIIGQQICPFMTTNNDSDDDDNTIGTIITNSDHLGPYGIDGIEPSTIAYRLCGSSSTTTNNNDNNNVVDMMSAFWNCICELQTSSQEEISCTVLATATTTTIDDDNDGDDNDKSTKSFETFTKLCNLLSHSLELYTNNDDDDAGGGKYELMYLHPNYDRDAAALPKDQYIKGHLPPTGWLKQILLKGEGGEVDDDEKQQLGEIHNYARRSPLPAIIIKRVSQLSIAAAAQQKQQKLDGDSTKNVVDVDKLVNKGIAKSKIDTYKKNLMKLMKLGKDELQSSLESEIEQTKNSSK